MRDLSISKDLSPMFSIVMPIFNQGPIIKSVLDSVTKYTQGLYEIIMIIDACSDDTESRVMQWSAETVIPPEVCRISIHVSDHPLFETSSDNIGFRYSRGRYILEIQADMEMTQLGYNLHLLKPFNILSNVFAVSGRLGWSWTSTDCIGKIGSLMDEPLDRSIDRDAFYVAETVARGPLLIDHEKLKSLGYLNETDYFLEGSEHDVIARAFFNHGWISGYVPIEFYSPLCRGSTRKPRDGINAHVYQQKKIECPNDRLFLELYKDQPARRIYKISII